jgi:hypothetical protein
MVTNQAAILKAIRVAAKLPKPRSFAVDLKN